MNFQENPLTNEQNVNYLKPFQDFPASARNQQYQLTTLQSVLLYGH